MHDYNHEDALELIKADFDFYFLPSHLTLAQMTQSEAWLLDVTLAQLAKSEIHSKNALDSWQFTKSGLEG